MRLIDADALKEVFTLPKEYTDKKDESFYHVSFPIIRATIDDAPTVDAVEVVRCKDCKYAHMTYGGECKYCDVWEAEGEMYLDGDFYCAFGERREDGKQ